MHQYTEASFVSKSHCSNSATISYTLTNAKVKQWLVQMARIVVTLCFAFSFYFLLVCVVSGHSISFFPHKSDSVSQSSLPTLSSLKPENLKYESADVVDSNAVIEAILDSSEDQTRVSKPKLTRLLAAQSLKSRDLSKNSLHTHRYSVVKHDINEDMDESYSDCGYHLAFTLIEQNTNEHQYKSKLMNKFVNTLSSILANINSTNLDPGSLCIHLITDDSIRSHIRDAIAKVHEELMRKSNQNNHNHHFRHFHKSEQDQEHDQHRPLTRYFFIDSATIEMRLEYLLPTLRAFFTHKPNSYYSNALFFYSLVLHQVIPASMADRLILLDVDVQLNANLLELYEEFGRFKPDEVIGIAYEQQPVYRHILNEYRRDNANTTVGSPPPNGFPGFNSGVLLLHLRKLRDSKLYNSLLDSTVISHLCRKYRFRGHLGDQDFYTVAAFDFRQLFHTLPCGWNRQLCQWWRFHGYGSVFDAYHQCDSSVQLYHGNCNSALPSLPSYGEYRK